MELDHEPQLVDRIGVAQRVLVVDRAVLVKLEKVLVEGLHAELAGLLHDLLDLMHLALEDQVGDQGGVQHDLDCRSPPLALLLRDKPLRNQRADVERQVHQHLVLTLFREEVDDAVERLVGAVGVQRRHAQVTGLGKGDGVVHGVAVADLADQDHVRGLAQRVLERRVPRVGVHAHFALGDDAVLVVVHVLDRVLDGDDVPVAVLVAITDHRRERRGFPRARAAHHDDEAALGHDYVLEHRRKIEVLELRYRGGDRPQHHADAALLHEGAHPEAADAAGVDGEIAFLGSLELLRLLVVHHRARQLRRVLHVELLARHRRHLAVELDGGREARGDEEVRPLLGHHRLQEVVHELDCLVSFHTLLLPVCAVRRALAAYLQLTLLAALLRASSTEMTLRLTRSWRFWSSVCMPYCWPVWIAEYICATLASRIRLRIAGVPTMISCAATRPEPSLVLSSACEITARSDSDSIARIISFSSAGNTSMIRSMVLAAELVCSVPNTRWPVSAAVIARRMVSRSRSSPTRIMSGSSRSAERSALANDKVCGPTSRWLIRHFLDSCTNSIGSSTVRMWPCSFSFLWLTIPARVVDLPEPVGPVTSTTPRGWSARSAKILGALRSSSDRIFEGIVRITAAAPRCCTKALTRKRARLGIAKEKSHSRFSS